MKAPQKKSKAQKASDIEKARQLANTYPLIVLIENSNILADELQRLRESVSGKLLFIKKKLLSKDFPGFDLKENYFILFGNEEDMAALEQFTFSDYLKAGDKVNKTVAIESGEVKNAKLEKYLGGVRVVGTKKFLDDRFIVCSEDDVVTSEQCEILRILAHRLGKSKLNILKKSNASEMFSKAQ